MFYSDLWWAVPYHTILLLTVPNDAIPRCDARYNTTIPVCDVLYNSNLFYSVLTGLHSSIRHSPYSLVYTTAYDTFPTHWFTQQHTLLSAITGLHNSIRYVPYSLFYTAAHDTIPYVSCRFPYNTMCRPIPYGTIQGCAVRYYTVLSGTMLDCMMPYCTAQQCVVLCGTSAFPSYISGVHPFR